MNISRVQYRIKQIRAHYLLGITFTTTIFSLLPFSPLEPPLLFPILGFQGHEKQLYFFLEKDQVHPDNPSRPPKSCDLSMIPNTSSQLYDFALVTEFLRARFPPLSNGA